MIDDVSKLSRSLHRCKHFLQLCDIFTDSEAYVVGGALRDAVLGLPITDIDLVLPADPTSRAKDFARKTGGSWFWLDQARLQSRVVFATSDEVPHYDFAPFRAENLQADLGDRDFTINAVALNLAQNTLHDPFLGLADLSQSLLRMVSDQAFANDPLRILKGIRHAATLGLAIEEVTLRSMQINVARLEDVAVERIRQEFWKVLSSDNAADGLLQLDACEAARILFGPDFTAALPVLEASVRLYQQRWDYLVRICPSAALWLESEIEQGVSVRTLLLFVLILQQVELSLPGKVAESWLLSRKAQKQINGLTALDAHTRGELAAVARNPRALYWWAQQKGVEARTLLLFLVCHMLPDDDDVKDIESWLPIAEQVECDRLPELVYGRWLTSHLGIDEGPEMSRALELLRNAEITGEVIDEEDARNFLSRVYLDSD